MAGKTAAILTAALMLAPAAFAAEPAAATAAAPAPQPEQTAKRYPFGKSDLTLIGIAKIGDEASITIEMPAGSTAGKDAPKVRRNFRKGARIPGSGYVIKEIGADSITLERDGKTESLKVSNGGGKAPDDASADGNSRRNGRRGPGRWMEGGTAVADYQKMSAEERQTAKKRLEAMKAFMEAGKKLAEADGRTDDRRSQMMARGEASISRVSDAYGLIDQVEAARAAGDTAKEKELSDALAAKQKEIEDADAQRRAEFEKMRQQRAEERAARAAAEAGGGEGGGDQPPPPPPGE